jgi:hypothetical protein
MPITLSNISGTGNFTLVNNTNSGRFAMSITPPPVSLVTTGLVLNLDAANTTSYSGSSTIWYDLSGNGNNFTKEVGTFVSSPIKSFSGGRFRGANTFFGDDMTIQAWFNTTSVGNNNNHYGMMQVMSAETLGNSNDFGFGVKQDAKLGFGAGPSDASVSTIASVNTGAWLNVAVTRTKSNGAVKLYLNGVLNRSGSSNSGNTLNAAANVFIGGGADQSKTWVGLMNDVLAYNLVLTDASVLQNYNAQKATYGI